ncbi:hypothetical protein LTR09_006623 [Extremus antarcticus]|uniref:FAD-binding domain-containing protein n=1 Tax=Extremus antarcticus TaxID=702011 RepID=A0AAJ0DEP0_9PEZI|nr:hypothetical protein LTR09_006623 [Extremus antarcticus]
MEEARRCGKAFAEPFAQLLDYTNPATLKVFNAMDKLPINHAELPDIPVVFIGDSNHAVSPFAGNGANIALMDGIDLATELCQTQGLFTARANFDKKSMARSTRTLKSSHVIITIAHSSGWWL